jgi:hypothetical protein
MPEKKVTIKSLLTEDNRKCIAELLLNNDITDMVVIYHENDSFQCRSSTPAIATTIGMLEMAKTFVMNDWQYSEMVEEDDQNKDNDS